MRKKRWIRRFARQERGATLALTAVMIAGVMSMLALAIDLGVLYVAHAEAQRAADGGALAGASAFLDFVPADAAVDPARARAYEFTRKNHIRGELIDSVQIKVLVNPDSQTVAVYVERPGLGMYFARLFGIEHRSVNAYAVAWATQASKARCIAPLAIVDWWAEGDTEDQDSMTNRVWDEAESWSWDPEADGDAYVGYNDDVVTDTTAWTGLGSMYRNGMVGQDGLSYNYDWGRPMVLKPQGPHDPHTPRPGWFFPIRLPGATGADDYRDAFTQCLPNQEVSIGDSLRVEDGNMVGPTEKAYDDVVDLDPTGMDPGYWADPALYGGQDIVKASPRTLAFVMITPTQLADIQAGGGNAVMEVSDIALYYIEGYRDLQGTSDDALIGRFLEYASGGAGGSGPSGSLIKTVQLIK